MTLPQTITTVDEKTGSTPTAAARRQITPSGAWQGEIIRVFGNGATRAVMCHLAVLLATGATCAHPSMPLQRARTGNSLSDAINIRR